MTDFTILNPVQAGLFWRNIVQNSKVQTWQDDTLTQNLSKTQNFDDVTPAMFEVEILYLLSDLA